ncbi:MAG TPA: peptidoglycan DD-metalloendopeptidase family protein [Thermohalobaculum sp.]|nr:peptidoglycan DD-metalloendopeptidase family protein [Thermohalobaculum sp.]
MEEESRESRRSGPLRGCAGGFLALLLAGSALGGALIGGGVIGYQFGLKAEGPVLSAPARAVAAGFAAPDARLAAEAPAVEEVRSDYQSRLAAMEREQKRLKTALESARSRHEEAQRELGRTERAFAEASSELLEASTKLAALRTDDRRKGAEALGDTEALVDAQSAVNELRLELAEAESEKDGLADTLGTLASTMEKVIAERDDAAERAETLGAHVASLAEEQDALLDRIEDAARVSLDGMRGMFERTGLDLDRILGETKDSHTGAGGPFEALAGEVSAREVSAETEARLAALMTDLEQVNLMRFAALRMPIGAPTTGRLTSSFGPRRDPLGRGHALHKGVDFAGPEGTPIHATGDGEVTFAGWQRGYGRIVTIRHAFGIETRYAHLSKAHVKVGERVTRGQRIADMGNTGRSTGTHLHYEVRIDREALDPANFINAGEGFLIKRS